MKTNIMASLSLVVAFVFTACNSEAQNAPTTAKTTAKAKIEVIQFHSEHRCTSCNKIEELSRQALKSYPGVPFSLVNVDDAKNEKRAAEFEAYGTALFLYNPKTGAKKNLTEFAFMTVQNETKFVADLKKYIDEFMKL